MAAIEWDEQYSVGVKIIDEQHKHFIVIIDTLFEDLEHNQIDKIPATLKELSDYANYHMETEEKYFDEFNYVGAEEHKSQHRWFKDEIKKYTERSDSMIIVGYDLMDFLVRWLMSHVNTMDKKYTECFHEHGLY